MFSVVALTLAVSLRALPLVRTAAGFALQNPAAVTVEHDNLEPDRPDVTNGTHIVDVGLLQMEIGTVLTRNGGSHSSGTPTTMRVGLTEWLEARLGTDGFLSVTDPNGTQQGLGNVQVGAKLR